MSRQKCRWTKNNGERCGNYPLLKSDFCFRHQQNKKKWIAGSIVTLIALTAGLITIVSQLNTESTRKLFNLECNRRIDLGCSLNIPSSGAKINSSSNNGTSINIQQGYKVYPYTIVDTFYENSQGRGTIMKFWKDDKVPYEESQLLTEIKFPESEYIMPNKRPFTIDIIDNKIHISGEIKDFYENKRILAFDGNEFTKFNDDCSITWQKGYAGNGKEFDSVEIIDQYGLVCFLLGYDLRRLKFYYMGYFKSGRFYYIYGPHKISRTKDKQEALSLIDEIPRHFNHSPNSKLGERVIVKRYDQ